MAQSATTPNASTGNTTSKLWEVHSQLENLDESEVASMSDTELVRLREAVKAVEDKAESFRKDVTDDCLKDRIPEGDSLLGLSHIASHNKYLKEDDGTVVMRAVSKGIDYTDFVQVNASTLADQYPDLAEIGESEYSYLR